jgi:phage tail sheath protein FI
MTVPRFLISFAIVGGLGFTAVAGHASAQSADTLVATAYSAPALPRDMTRRPVQVYLEDDSAAPALSTTPPRNLITSLALRREIAAMMAASPTFRRQCARVAAATELIVILSITTPDMVRASRAITQFGMESSGHLIARVTLAPTGQLEELVAHEFEHVLEQLDGVDLPALAKRGRRTGVSVTSAWQFETERATVIGRQVAAEVNDARRRR